MRRSQVLRHNRQVRVLSTHPRYSVQRQGKLTCAAVVTAFSVQLRASILTVINETMPTGRCPPTCAAVVMAFSVQRRASILTVINETIPAGRCPPREGAGRSLCNVLKIWTVKLFIIIKDMQL